MRVAITLALLSALLAAARPAAAQGADSFQFAPPPLPLLNLRAVDLQTVGSLIYVRQKTENFNFHAIDLGAGSMAKQWGNGGFLLGLNGQLILGTGEIPIDPALGGGTFDITMAGMGFNFAPSLNFDLYGRQSDDFSLPFYFGPHLAGSFIAGNSDFDASIPCGAGCSTEISVDTTLINYLFNYGWQAGIQAGINLGEALKFVPYVDFRQDLGGTFGGSITNTCFAVTDPPIGPTLVTDCSSTTSFSGSLGSQPMATTPGFDLQLRKVGLSIGGAVQQLKQAGSTSGQKVKSTIINIRWTKKFTSICGL